MEAGLPDHTGTGRGGTPEGALDLENMFSDQGTSGVLLQFADPSTGEEYTYAVYVVRSPTGTELAARCPETLFQQSYAPEADAGPKILQHVRQHNAAFFGWRAQGGEVSFGERLAVHEVRGASCDRAVVRFLEELRRDGIPLATGPAKGWWNDRQRQLAAGIVAGKGSEPYYRTRPELAERNTPEMIEQVERLRFAGALMLVSGSIAGVAACGGVAYSSWTMWQVS